MGNNNEHPLRAKRESWFSGGLHPPKSCTSEHRVAAVIEI